MRGHWVLLREAWQELRSLQPYPPAVDELLGQTVTAVVLLAATLKFEGKLTLQLSGTGPVSLLVAQCTHDFRIRAVAQHAEALDPDSPFHTLVGTGRLVVTVEATERGARYVVTLPPGSDRRGFLGRAVAWITSPVAVARELSEAHAKLLVRYDELDSARSALAVEAARLEELRRARDVLAATVTDLQEVRAVRERIFANVNHDLRTPLSNIMLAVSIIRSAKETSGNPAVGRALETIERSAARQLRLVDDMLLLAESREQELHVRPRPCDLRHLVDDVLRGWAPIAQARGLELRAETATPCHVNGDPDAMERILANLLSNAVKFTPRGGRVEVRLTSQHDRAMLEVRDTGRGIDKELLPRLFGRFERGGAAASGSGIGLSIVKELVLAQRGTIDVVTPEGGGAAFRISWPLLDRAEARQADALG